MLEMTAQREWLTVFQLPSYAPELNPQEGVWANLRLGLVNLKPLLGGIDDLATLVKAGLKRMQYRTDGLIDGFLSETKLTFDQA
jgi:transposase